mmetsp:Transcript_430/g.1762  ORF Transcript_430/g.1762 Transcript_430/m.1762 type:complete len:337 (+) Transcript_430:1634-2644(+)
MLLRERLLASVAVPNGRGRLRHALPVDDDRLRLRALAVAAGGGAEAAPARREAGVEGGAAAHGVVVRVHHAVHPVEHAPRAPEEPAAPAERAHRTHGAAAEKRIIPKRVPTPGVFSSGSPRAPAAAVVHVPGTASATRERVHVSEEIVEGVAPAEDLAEDLERVVVEPARGLVPSAAARARRGAPAAGIEGSESSSIAGCGALDALDAVPVVRRALVVVAEDLVRGGNLLEHRLRALLIVGILVGVPPHGELAVRAANLVAVRAWAHPQHRVQILLHVAGTDVDSFSSSHVHSCVSRGELRGASASTKPSSGFEGFRLGGVGRYEPPAGPSPQARR